jgi:hypothetical protein
VASGTPRGSSADIATVAAGTTVGLDRTAVGSVPAHAFGLCLVLVRPGGGRDAIGRQRTAGDLGKD